MMTKTLLFLATAPLLLAACSHGTRPNTQAPAWVHGTSEHYPASRYLTGHGQADSLAVARDRARADLAKTFAVKINAQSDDTSTSTRTSASTTDHTLKLKRHIATQTDALISGIRIVDSWQNPTTQSNYALAVLPRQKAATALRQQITELDDGTQSNLQSARASQDLLAKIAASNQAVALQTQRAKLQSKLRVVSIAGHGITPRWSLDTLKADRAALLKRVTVAGVAKGANADQVQPMLAGALADAGFTVQHSAHYTITATLDYKPLPPRNGWYWLTGTLTLAMSGQHQTHHTARWTLKTSATAANLARQRLLDQVNTILYKRLPTAVLEFASGSRGS